MWNRRSTEPYDTILQAVLTRHSELGREKMWARIHLTPLLQAEEDRDQVRRYWADQAREKELMGDNAKVYHTDRYLDPLSLDHEDWSCDVMLTCCRFVRPTFAVAPNATK